MYLYAVQMLIPEYKFQPIKIGFSAEPARRIKEFTRGPFPTVLLGQWSAPNGLRDESELHTRFREYRLSGEWFYPAPELLDFLSHADRRISPYQENRKLEDFQGKPAFLPDPFDVSEYVSVGVEGYLSHLDKRWPKVGNKDCFVKCRHASELTGIPEAHLRRYVTPLKFGGAIRYSLTFIKSFARENHLYLKRIQVI